MIRQKGLITMNKSAILHIPLSQYAFAQKPQKLTIRIRTARADLTKVTLYYGDRCCKKSPVEFFPLVMKRASLDEEFDYYEVSFQSPFTRVCYYFKLEKEDEWYYYYADEFTNELPDLTIDGKVVEGRSEYYQYPFILQSEILDVPEWFKHAVVYNIFPDSFASGKTVLSNQEKVIQNMDGTVSKSRLGGTIRGIIDNLDYIQKMGFNCIYLNPIFRAGESHKYDIFDYYDIDPCFGDKAEFARLVTDLHARGMHIIIDGVFNHCSWQFFAFEDVIKNQEQSEYKDWFYHLNFPVTRPQREEETPNYDCFAYERKMPKLNTSNTKVQEYFEAVCRFWIREFDIDGWRLDVANEIDRNFWRRFRNAAKEEKADCVLIGEVWENSESWLRGDAFDSTMNYDFRKHCRDFFGLQTITAQSFAGRITSMYLRYPRNITIGQLNLLDSHDVPRFLSICHQSMGQYHLALVFLFLSCGVPSLFYGDEREISGIQEKEYRSPMPWNQTLTNTYDLISRLIRIRTTLTEHDDSIEFVEEPQNQWLLHIRRRTKHNVMDILLNNQEETAVWTASEQEMAVLEYRAQNQMEENIQKAESRKQEELSQGAESSEPAELRQEAEKEQGEMIEFGPYGYGIYVQRNCTID